MAGSRKNLQDCVDAQTGIAGAVRVWAEQALHRAALIDNDVVLSRGDLLTWCTVTAALLHRLAAVAADERPELCAILIPRSWAVPLGLIAARFAGMAFLLLDPDQPAARLGAIMAVARPAILLGRAGDRRSGEAALEASGLQPAGAPVPIAPPAAGLETLVARKLARPCRLPPGTGHLVFTSGSTGIPKGVILQDQALLQTVAAQRRWLGTNGTGPHARAPSVWALNPGFDASLSDIFCAILGSAPLLVFREEQTRWRSLAAVIARHGAARADLAPSLLRLLQPEVLGLRALIFGGERCDPATAERWGAAVLAFQAYGPTEAAVCATMARAGPGWIPGLLGRPLPHQVVLLSSVTGVFRVLPRIPSAANADAADDADDASAFNATILEPPATGPVTGEIWLAGDAVATGYLDAPDAERERFGVHDGLRVHRTGDIAQWRDGHLAWLGRRDRQLKLRGRLVCPEEVEAVAADVWGGPCACLPEGNGLVLALGPGGTGQPDRVLAAVGLRLGPAMTPHRAVPIPFWPLSLHGKTDLGLVRDALVRDALARDALARPRA